MPPSTDPNATSLSNSYIGITVSNFQNTYVYINTGSSDDDVGTQYIVSDNTSTNYTFEADTIVYIVAIAHSPNP
jgi:hypothetical protein